MFYINKIAEIMPEFGRLVLTSANFDFLQDMKLVAAAPFQMAYEETWDSTYMRDNYLDSYKRKKTTKNKLIEFIKAVELGNGERAMGFTRKMHKLMAIRLRSGSSIRLEGRQVHIADTGCARPFSPREPGVNSGIFSGLIKTAYSDINALTDRGAVASNDLLHKLAWYMLIPEISNCTRCAEFMHTLNTGRLECNSCGMNIARGDYDVEEYRADLGKNIYSYYENLFKLFGLTYEDTADEKEIENLTGLMF